MDFGDIPFTEVRKNDMTRAVFAVFCFSSKFLFISDDVHLLVVLHLQFFLFSENQPGPVVFMFFFWGGLLKSHGSQVRGAS